MSDNATFCALYLRISQDRDMDGLAIERQRGECMRIVEQHGWTVYDEYIDQSISATNKDKKRPAYDAMCADYKRGLFSAIVCYDLDRLTRQPRQLEDWIDAAEDKGLMLVTANGEADLSTDGGRMYARVKAAVARGEVERKGARHHLAHQQRAKMGMPPTGVRPTGYTIDGKIIEDEAQVVRAIYRAFDSGSSIKAIARALSGETGERAAAGVPPARRHSVTLAIERNEKRREKGVKERPLPADAPWSSSSVLGILRNPRYAGYSTYTDSVALKKENRRRSWRSHIVRDEHGSPVMGNWEPIVELGLWERVNDKLNEEGRKSNKSGSTDRKHLGSGLYVCGICGKVIRSHTRGYRCAGHFTRSRARIDKYVEDVVKRRLQEGDIIALVPSGNEGRIAEINAEIDNHRGRIARAENDYDDELIEGRDLARVRSKEEAAISELEAERLRLMPKTVVSSVLSAPDPCAMFDSLDIGQKQEVVRSLMTVRILPHPRGDKSFDGSDVVIEWNMGHGADSQR